MKALKTFVLAAVLAPLAAAATSPEPGAYVLNGVQEICIVADGTWYGTAFRSWGGRWDQLDNTTLMRGNYFHGTGNDAMNFTGSTANGYTGFWQEWHDDRVFDDATAATLVFRSASCEGPDDKIGSPRRP